MSDIETKILYQQLKSIRGISKELIKKALLTNKNDMTKTINTISNITGLRIKKIGKKIELEINSSTESEEESDSGNESCICTCGKCHNNSIDTLKFLSKNNDFLEIRDNVIQQERFEVINLLIESIVVNASIEILETMVENQKLTLELLSDIKN